MTVSKWLGSTHGVGSIIDINRKYNDISYLIEIWRMHDGIIRVDGIIDAKLEIIGKIQKIEQPILSLDTGDKIQIIISNVHSGHAEFYVLGPVSKLLNYCGVKNVEQFDNS